MVNSTVMLKAFRLLVCLLIAFSLYIETVSAEPSETLQVGIEASPPFVIREPDGSLSGLGIDLWRYIAQKLDLSYEFKEMPFSELLHAVENKKIDAAVAAVTVTPVREAVMDFTHPYDSSGLGIAVPVHQGSVFANIIDAIFSKTFFHALMGLTLVLGFIALLLWLLERKANPSQFGGAPLKGLGAGFWWSAVTMTTVGYGDKSPVTFLGRLLAIIWMFASVITISGFTAAIASAFTVQQIHGSIQGPQDLHGHLIGTVTNSTSEKYAQLHSLEIESVATPEKALEALAQGKVAAVVFDLPILRYITNERYGNQIKVLPGSFQRQDYAIALPLKSPLRKAINRELLRYIISPEWQQEVAHYLGR